MTRVVRSSAVALAVFFAGCATCPPVDEAALASRVLDRVESILAGDDPEAGGASGEPAPGAGAPILPFDQLPRRGPASARVRVVVVSDFQCPFCGRVVPSLDRLREEFPDDVAIYFVNYPLPFHDRARPAAIAALEAFEQGGSDAFYRMHDKLFENQRSLATEDLLRFTVELGLDADAMRIALAEREHESEIDRDIELAGRLGVDGTPTTFVGGEIIVGAQPYSEFRDAVERALGR